MFHLDLAAASPSPNPRIYDLTVIFKTSSDPGAPTYERTAYGTLYTKILARWQGAPDEGSTGYWVQRNAENLANYALAKYVMTKNGNIYPHLPIVTWQAVGAPYLKFGGLLAEFVEKDDNFFWNTSSGVDAFESVWSEYDDSTCPDYGDEDATTEANLAVTIDGFAPNSAYPDGYNRQLASWIEALDPSGADDGSSSGGTTGATGSSGNGQQIALATYIDPGANPDTWNRLIGFPSDKVSVLVANVVNGPDSAINAGWTDVIPRAAASGKTVLSYVRTGYLGVSFQKFTTRLGSSHTSDWIAQIQEDVDQWYRLYGDDMGGIFFDEGWNDCGTNDKNAKLYRFITQETKRKYPGAFTVLTPGAPMPQCFKHSADMLLTAEVSYDTYTSGAYADVDWVPSDPRKLWHIVYDVPSDKVASVAKLARSRNVGMLHITNDIEPNPYDTIPDDTYIQNSLDAVEGGQPLIEALALYTGSTKRAEAPLRFQVDDFDYSSAKLSWLVTSDAAGYRIYQDGALILSLMPWMIEVTVGGLEPGTPYTFSITAVSASGIESEKSQLATTNTLALPGNGHTVASTSVSATDTQTIYKAKILVPYAFVRLFIWDGNCKFVADAPVPSTTADTPPPDPINWGWPINFQP
jgi:hypothetical protein